MKNLAVFALVFASILTGCSKKEGSPAADAPASAPSTAAATPATTGPKAVELSAGDNMKYDVTTIEATPGQEIKVTLTNKGTQPKEAMGHNFIILKPGNDPQAFVNAAVTAKATDYIPAALADQVLAHTKTLGPKQSDEVTFNAPTAPGEYVYFCSFPGHFLTGMKGTLIVK